MSLQGANFVHLHNHTLYSLLDGACRLDEMVENALRLGQPAVAMTDHGNLFGAVEFQNQALKAGIKPIIGCEVYVAPRSRFEKREASGIRIHGEYAYHLVLLAENASGYRNLMKLVSKAYIEGFYHRPRVDRELLSAHSEGLIALSACIGGEIPSAVLQGRIDEAEKLARQYRDIFGAGNFFLELQDHGMTEEAEVNEELIKMAARLNIPLVATNDCHYLTREDADAHDILLCIQTGKTVGEEERLRFPCREFYFKSLEEMERLFGHVPEALENTHRIAERCTFTFETGDYHLPRFQVPAGMDLESFFEKKVREGFEERRPALEDMASRGTLRRPLEEYRERLQMEIDVIKRMGFPGYFLIVWDVIRHAREKGIPVGPGRGSAVGSLVAWCLRITDLDPLQYDLLFERFLNPERRSLPDIDIDFCKRRRDEVIDYVRDKYGEDSVAQIVTFGTLKARQTIRDVGRALEVPYTEADRLAKMIPMDLKAKVEDGFQVQSFKEQYDNDPRVKRWVDSARRLEGLARHASTHAAGVVIAPGVISEYVPLLKGPTGDVLTQFSMTHVEAIGLLKMDFLGLRTLTVIDDAVKSIREETDTDLDLSALPLDDRQTYQLIGEARTGGVFQFEKSGVRDILRRLRPNCFEDLIAVNALNRPGPLQGGMVDDFIRLRHSQTGGTYMLPALEEVLKDTYGIVVYQEQVMRMARTVAGFTMGEADDLRKAMAKKLQDRMARIKKKFMEGAAKNRIKAATARQIWELIEKFGEYGFNKSHSTAYALLAYQTAYLKAHYPVHFMAALLTSEKNTPDKMVDYLAECREMNIRILPPDINESEMDFSVCDDQIRFGLSAVKNVGEGAIVSILAARDEAGGRFRSFYQFCEEVDLRLNNRRVIESLIKCGGFDSLGFRRSQLWSVLEKAMDRGQRRQSDREQGQHSLFGDVAGAEETWPDLAGEMPDVEDWSEKEMLGYEKELLGYYVTGHPLTQFEAVLSGFSTANSRTLAEQGDRSDAAVGGIISAYQQKKTRKGDLMSTFVLEDLEGRVEVIVFPDTYARCQQHLADDRPVMVVGSIERTETGGGREAKESDDDTAEEEQVRLLASDVFPLEQARERLAGSVTIRVSLTGLTDSVLEKLRRTLYDNSGKVPVKIVLEHPASFRLTMQPASSFFIKPSPATTRQIESLLGEGAVSFQRGPLPRNHRGQRGNGIRFPGGNGGPFRGRGRPFS